MLENFNIYKSMSIIHHINKLKQKISVDSEKDFDKIQHPFQIKSLQKVDIEGTYLNIIRPYMTNTQLNIIFNGKKLKAFPLRSGTR